MKNLHLLVCYLTLFLTVDACINMGGGCCGGGGGGCCMPSGGGGGGCCMPSGGGCAPSYGSAYGPQPAGCNLCSLCGGGGGGGYASSPIGCAPAVAAPVVAAPVIGPAPVAECAPTPVCAPTSVARPYRVGVPASSYAVAPSQVQVAPACAPSVSTGSVYTGSVGSTPCIPVSGSSDTGTTIVETYRTSPTGTHADDESFVTLPSIFESSKYKKFQDVDFPIERELRRSSSPLSSRPLTQEEVDFPTPEDRREVARFLDTLRNERNGFSNEELDFPTPTEARLRAPDDFAKKMSAARRQRLMYLYKKFFRRYRNKKSK